ncbi:hypothetical protein SAMN03080615_01652 [Amphritea atlantica]|uniref:Uncharacterized protein n=1 Tax=Amphritea atlantica TaxID=355243 RepID=A0A1H9GFH0_9GAMM|nr:hypothetical protein [Amphritea atlantica]SEQ48841.1 hypothetical protein SAMN03080615_01652 [Amphritea atlantica]
MKVFLADAIEILKSYLAYGLPGGMGAGANYLFQHSSKGKPLNWKGFIIFILLGGFTVNMIGPNLPVDMPGRDGALFGLGFMFWPILAALDSRGEAIAGWFVSRFTK